MDSTLSPSTEVDPALTFLRSPASDLKKFKVLGTIDKVILVLDKDTEETYIIKVNLSGHVKFLLLFQEMGGKN
jgi:hypothetical protein